MGHRAFKPGVLNAAVVAEIRDALPISQAALAEVLGIARSTAEKWMQGGTSLNVDQVALIAAVIGVNASELVQRAERRLLRDFLANAQSPDL